MVQYRRNKVKGGTYFFTITLRDRRLDILTRRIDDFRACYNKVKQQYPFKTLSYVVLPEHGHFLWQLPPDDDDYILRWREIKKRFTQMLKKDIPLVRNKHGEYNLWQRRYWEHTIKDERDFESHVNYIHFNPVKHGLVHRVQDWPYSSFFHFVDRGMLGLDWAGVESLLCDFEYGEWGCKP